MELVCCVLYEFINYKHNMKWTLWTHLMINFYYFISSNIYLLIVSYLFSQEILQTLGRKRLMEARKAAGPPALKKHTEKKSSPLHLLGHSIRKGSDDSPGEKTGKRIVEKLRSDVKGLRNAIRRSRKSNSRYVILISDQIQ